MDQGNAVHPPYSLTQLTPYLSQVGFIKLGVLLVGVDEIKQLGSAHLLQHEAVIGGCRKRMHEGHDVGVAHVLKIEDSVSTEWASEQPMTHPEDLDLSNKAHPCPIVDSAIRQFDGH